MKKSLVKKYILNWYGILALIVLIIVSYFLFFGGQSKQIFEFATVESGRIVQKVSVTGRVSPVEKADLAFQKGGVIKKVYVSVGQTIAKGQPIALLESASDEAALASAKAKLADLSRGLNIEELRVEQAKVKSTEVSLLNAKQDALNATRSAFVLAQGAIVKYIDGLFTNPQSANPTISVRTRSYTEQITINLNKVIVSEVFIQWKAVIDDGSDSQQAALDKIAKADKYLGTIKDLIDRLLITVSDLNPGNSGLTQTVIDGHVQAVNSAMVALNQAIDTVSSAKTALENAIAAHDQAQSNFNLKSVGSSAQSVAAQAAIVDQYRAELAKGKIDSPIDGLITRADPHQGEYVSPGTVSFSVISDGDYKIEAYVPEADIAKITIDNIASTTLDAYGQAVDFPAIVTAVDPGENVLEGVPTYKVTLKFAMSDSRIRPGMTANLEIVTASRDGVLKIPNRAVFDEEGVKSVRVLEADGKTFKIVPVTVGLKSFDGQIEVINGLNEGEKVVTYVK